MNWQEWLMNFAKLNLRVKILFRVDVTQQIGTGHFMRCLTLADALSQRCAQIRFITRHLPVYLQDMLRDRGYEFRMLESPANEKIDDLAHSHWLGTTQRSDAEEALQLLSDRTWEWLVVDHYALDARWESILRQRVKNILVIDDIADRQHDCDILLDQNFYADMESRYSGKVPEHCRLLLGPRYALLRDEFRQLHKQVKPRSGPAKRIFVFFGGVDIDNYTGRAIDALVDLDMNGLHVDVVVGAQHPYREQIQAACAEHRFTCYVQTDRMAELMAAADLAIGAGGSATWERCCLGLPTLTVSLANNQTEIAKGLDLSVACQYVGSQETATVKVLNKAVVELLKDNNRLQAISTQAYSFVDGLGVDRVSKELLS
ncbi:UDP-2,4-diacetamido-2,4,6-trideoxy-beta-L-altropyranose hydrolase [Chlorobium phaeovibrioides]|uniref:UDP-2,4-diacetamido-2,4, 6-trideoxy-beta-L-altropyranose hydrolase n=1 Tax=Chlorobium phaeovibrioides TaxID=1094 RepID=A0A5M8ICA4_CHLPH|nr:UDP-2,4-diacetamido-2,4,6-trideoxy-beta-L-altropyranose hydrolase [Chlorobium phaeovibrioides]KAA6232062.1 UDP-2,4-diacetamido-2,4,6-trideoxy-beta-L-altropyranose hydrolase [Chlorobium phaeovibrioides]